MFWFASILLGVPWTQAVWQPWSWLQHLAPDRDPVTFAMVKLGKDQYLCHESCPKSSTIIIAGGYIVDDPRARVVCVNTPAPWQDLCYLLPMIEIIQTFLLPSPLWMPTIWGPVQAWRT